LFYRSLLLELLSLLPPPSLLLLLLIESSQELVSLMPKSLSTELRSGWRSGSGSGAKQALAHGDPWGQCELPATLKGKAAGGIRHAWRNLRARTSARAKAGVPAD
jgi:hypothetical protein